MKHTTSAFQYQKYGTPDVLTLSEVSLDSPNANEVQIRHTAIGVNFIDIYQRNGTDRSNALPARIGVEGVGVIDNIGDGQETFAIGDRVAYVGGPPGAYSVIRNVPAGRVVKLPDWIDDEVAASLIFKGLTAEYLINRCAPAEAGQTALFHAAAGGVGSIACQWLHAKGVTVIGAVGSEEKRAQAHRNGCEHVLLSDDPDFVSKVHDLTGGVHVVYDSVGQTTFINSLDCLRPRGTMVSFGASSGAPPEISVADLVGRGSLFLTRPSIAHYTSDAREYQSAADHLFQAIFEGIIKPSEITKMPLSEAQEAHALLESRKTTGSLLLIP